MLKMVSPLAAFGAGAVISWDQSIGGSVNHQYTPMAAIPAKSSTRKIRRGIQPTLILGRTLLALHRSSHRMPENIATQRPILGIKRNSLCCEIGTITEV